MKKEIRVFLMAVMFYTRIPCPKDFKCTQETLNKSARYYPLIGCIVGGFAALVYCATNLVFSHSISILISMGATILITGAFHEDGFADVCDGFGGGWDKKQILEIMKDSRLGTYGTIGLIFILSCKFLVLREINAQFIPIILIIGHSLSRYISSIFRITNQYVRENDDSKVKPMAKEISFGDMMFSSIFGLLPLLLLDNIFAFVLIIPVIMKQFFYIPIE